MGDMEMDKAEIAAGLMANTKSVIAIVVGI